MGEIESRKEFITRMFLFMNELPQEKKNDLNTILCFLEFQMKIREMDYIKLAVKKMIAGVDEVSRPNYAQKARMIHMFESTFSEVDYQFVAATDDEKFEFLTSKSTKEYVDGKKDAKDCAR